MPLAELVTALELLLLRATPAFQADKSAFCSTLS